jgi:hypothetical protein
MQVIWRTSALAGVLAIGSILGIGVPSAKAQQYYQPQQPYYQPTQQYYYPQQQQYYYWSFANSVSAALK